MIRQHLTTGVPRLTFHLWPWAESFSYRGQPSISTHQSHIYAAPFHSPPTFPGPDIHHYALPFHWHLGKHKHFTTPPICRSCPETHTYSKCTHLVLQWWLLENMLLCCVVLSGDLQVHARSCSLVTRLLRYQCLHWDMTWGWNPSAHWQLRPLQNRQPVVTDCGHEHPEDHLARKPPDQKSLTSRTSVILRLSCAAGCQRSDICNALAPFTASFFNLTLSIFVP